VLPFPGRRKVKKKNFFSKIFSLPLFLSLPSERERERESTRDRRRDTEKKNYFFSLFLFLSFLHNIPFIISSLLRLSDSLFILLFFHLLSLFLSFSPPPLALFSFFLKKRKGKERI